MWLDDLKLQIEEIKKSQYYEGDFGGMVTDESILFSEMGNENISYLNDYCDFMRQIGFGELDASFYLEDGPIPYQNVYGREIPELEGKYIFATDQSEYSYVFDAMNNFQVLDVDASGKLNNQYGDFKEFIIKKVEEIKEMYVWREANL